ncbi:MAG TPA: tetratricopeptide repeat protein, partial [Blastocatellia bacterium]|nr:tetratricopeptide repeat protein [Blastocatellia bacterium]
ACLLALLSSIAFWEARRRHPQAAPLNSIAVLPFINESRDSDTEYLSDGMTETITRDLSKIPNLRVISRSSAFRYREKEINPQSIGRELNVQAVLIGRIQKSGERLSLSTELINVEDNSQIWSEQYNRRITDALALQEEIPITIARRLQVKLSGADRARLNIRDTADVEAYRHYMKGRYFWDKRSAEGMQKAQEHFEQAIAIDPNYALAYAGLADCFALTDASPSPHSEGYAKAKSAAIQALALDETLAEAHTSLAWIKFNYEWDWGSAENEFNRAIELNPNYATAHHWYSVYLSYMGRYDEAITEIKKAQELDPLSLIVNTNVGVILSLARRYDEAIEELTKVLEMDPNFIRARLRLGLTYPYKKMYEEAIAQIQNGLSIANDEPSLLAALGSVYARSGQRSRAKQILQQVKQMQGRDGFRAMALANIYRDLGETEQALMYLQEAYEAHDTSLFEIKGEEVWDSLRSDPRFIDLLRRVEAGGVGSQQLGQGLK